MQGLGDIPCRSGTIIGRGLEIFPALGYYRDLDFEGFPVFRLGHWWWNRTVLSAAMVLFLAVGLAPASQPIWAKAASTVDVEQHVRLPDLPQEARRTYRLIGQGGPFPYRKDGTTFFNRERLLPAKPRGYYREYTVRTPGASNRGARRIVCGGQEPTKPSNCYYTADHYASFRLIIE